MDKIITPETRARLDVMLAELCILRDEFPNIESYEGRSANALRRVQISREASELLGYNAKEEDIVEMDLKNDLNDK